MNFIFYFSLISALLLMGNVVCQDSHEFPLVSSCEGLVISSSLAEGKTTFHSIVRVDNDEPLPTELNISQGYTASLRKLDPNLGRTMMVSLQVKALDSFQLALIDKFNKEVAVFELRKDPPKASVKYYAREMTADITTKDDLECSVPNNGTNFEFFIKFNLATGPLEYSCGNYSLILDATKAGHHLWENLTRVRLTGEGSYSSLTYVPVGIPSVATYRNDWQVFLPGKKYLRRGDVLEAAFKVKTTWHPYFFTLSASGSNDHWFCYVRTEHQLVRIYHGGPCWVVDYDWYEQGGYSFTTTNNIPPMSVDSIFLVQIVFADGTYKIYIDSEYSTEVESHKSWQEPPTRMIYSTMHLELLWIRFLGV